MVTTRRKASGLAFFAILFAYNANVCGMETSQLFIKKADFKEYLNQARSGRVSKELFHVQAVYEMLAATNLDTLIDATARAAHFVPLLVEIEEGKVLDLEKVSDCSRLLLSRIKTSNLNNIQSVHYFDHEIATKFCRAFYKYAPASEKAEILLKISEN